MAYTPIPANSATSAASSATFVTATASSDLSSEVNLGALTTGLPKMTVSAGTATLTTADPALDYVSPAKTANVASATTITLPETGIVVPITGNTQIDYITVPTGSAPRFVILWMQSANTIRHEVAGAGAGAALVSMFPTGGAANLAISIAANSFLFLLFDGTVWRRVHAGAHWDGTGVTGLTANTNAKLTLDASTGSKLQWGSATSYLADGATCTIVAPAMVLSNRPKLTKASVASASNVTLTAGCPFVLLTGTTTINTFTATGWTEGMVVWLKFDGVLTITNNSGGTNDFVSRDGTLNITTAAGMVLPFMFDGTDMREVGRT